MPGIRRQDALQIAIQFFYYLESLPSLQQP